MNFKKVQFCALFSTPNFFIVKIFKKRLYFLIVSSYNSIECHNDCRNKKCNLT